MVVLGPQSVVAAVVAQLNARLNSVVSRLRDEYEMHVTELPEIGEVLDHTPNVAVIGEFPVVFVAWTGADQESLATVATSAGGLSEEYTYTYRVQVYALCMADTFSGTEMQQRVMEQAVREAVLARKDLTPEKAQEGEQIRVNAVGVRSEPSDVFPDANSRYLGAVMVEIPLTVDEGLDLSHLDTGRSKIEPVHPGLL